MSRLDPMGVFIARIYACKKLLKRIEEFIGDHLEVDPEKVDWGNVGDANSLRAKLEDIIDSFGIASESESDSWREK